MPWSRPSVGKTQVHLKPPCQHQPSTEGTAGPHKGGLRARQAGGIWAVPGAEPAGWSLRFLVGTAGEWFPWRWVQPLNTTWEVRSQSSGLEASASKCPFQPDTWHRAMPLIALGLGWLVCRGLQPLYLVLNTICGLWLKGKGSGVAGSWGRGAWSVSWPARRAWSLPLPRTSSTQISAQTLFTPLPVDLQSPPLWFAGVTT